MKNFFEYYGLPVRFGIDAAELKRRFLLKSKATHPDFFTLAGAEEQERANQKAALNNEAYKTLADSDKRTRHILEIFGLFDEQEKEQLSPDFLAEMMDINEALMESAFDPKLKETTRRQIQEKENAIEAEFQHLAQAFDNHPDPQILQKIKTLYFKKKYLRRLQQNLD